MPDDKTDKSKETKDDQLSPLSIGDIQDLISKTVEKVVGSLKSTESDTHAKATEHTESQLSRKSDVADQTETVVRRELEKMQRQEAQDKRDSEIDALLKKERERPQETAPVERGRLHKFMGWGD